MHTLPHARLPPIGGERLFRQYPDESRSSAQLAIEHGISERTTRPWLALFQNGGLAALEDRWNVPCLQRRSFDPLQLLQSVELRAPEMVSQEDREGPKGFPLENRTDDDCPGAGAALAEGFSESVELGINCSIEALPMRKPGDAIHVDI